MDNSSTASSKDPIIIWNTWALSVTHEACEYTNKKFVAEKTGGDPVIPSPKLDTDLVMACDQLVNRLIKAYKNPIKMKIDIARYSRFISPKDTGHNEEREEKLLQKCPPGHEGTKLIDIPATIIDASGAIIAWYLPDALTNATQKEMLAASEFLGPSLTKSVKADSNWQTNPEWFKDSSDDVGLTPGCLNFSPAWFQLGHEDVSDPEVSASLKGPSSESILEAIARPAAIATVALRVIQITLGEKAESNELPKMSETLQYWASVFNTLSIISNRETPNHRDHLSMPECFDILTTAGDYSNARMSMPSLQLEFKYNPGCMIVFSGRIVRHGVHAVQGDRIAWAWYMRDSVQSYAGVPSSGWARKVHIGVNLSREGA
ncbi:hypothetical protein P692DRAFT_201796918 [Suillus brevipes Sb2]|nr:hypothetical protein P692DRAFT_201796918 [Suillus brevipes Sb2]